MLRQGKIYSTEVLFIATHFSQSSKSSPVICSFPWNKSLLSQVWCYLRCYLNAEPLKGSMRSRGWLVLISLPLSLSWLFCRRKSGQREQEESSTRSSCTVSDLQSKMSQRLHQLNPAWLDHFKEQALTLSYLDFLNSDHSTPSYVDACLFVSYET